MEGENPFHATVRDHHTDNHGRLILETTTPGVENNLVVEEGYELAWASSLLSDESRESLSVMTGGEY